LTSEHAMSYVLFYCEPYTGYLHSFPTRRSSDLLPDVDVLAIELDGPAYHALATARDRDRLRPEHLARLGWHVERVWSTDWQADRSEEHTSELQSREKSRMPSSA